MKVACPTCGFPIDLMQTKIHTTPKSDERWVWCPYGHSFDPWKARADQRARELPFLYKHFRPVL